MYKIRPSQYFLFNLTFRKKNDVVKYNTTMDCFITEF